jgi:hypothetical protein
VQQQNPDGFPTHSRHQLPFNRLLRHQSHGPTCLALGWTAAYHGDNVLLLMGIQHLCRAVTLFLIQRTAQAGPLVAMAQPPDCLRGQLHHFVDLGRTGMLSQLQERQCPEDDRTCCTPPLTNFRSSC